MESAAGRYLPVDFFGVPRRKNEEDREERDARRVTQCGGQRGALARRRLLRTTAAARRVEVHAAAEQQ